MTNPDAQHRSMAHRALRARHIDAVASRFLAQRPLVIGVAGLLLVGVLWSGPIMLEQAVGVSVGVSVVLAGFFYERHVARRRGMSALEFERSLLLTTAAVTVLCCATGGLYSPMLPIFFAPVVTMFAAFGKSAATWRMIILVGIATCVVIVASMIWPQTRLPEPYRTWLLGSTLLTSMVLLYLSVTGVTRALDSSAAELDAMRRAQHDRALRRARDVESMSARAAHELKNPLSTIKGLVQLEARQVSDQEARRGKRFEMIMHEIERSQSLIHEHLSFARRMTDLERHTHTCDKLVAMLEQLAASRHAIHLEQRVELSVNEAIRCDEHMIAVDLDKLHQAVSNLVENAQHASAPGALIELKLEQDASDGVLLCVEDHGEGMSQEMLSQVGSAYFTGKAKGTGLGVLIARAIIVQHGGELRYESTPGEGTRALMRLPFLDESE